jgi:ABC-type oligopeptide transport system ATPase subunit
VQGWRKFELALTLLQEMSATWSSTGPSGGGKTTLLKLLVGLHRPTSGTIEVDGNRVDPELWRAWRAHVGIVAQDDRLLSGTIADNIAFFDPDHECERPLRTNRTRIALASRGGAQRRSFNQNRKKCDPRHSGGAAVERQCGNDDGMVPRRTCKATTILEDAMTTNLQHNENRPLSEAELDAVNGGTITMTDKWTALRQELSFAYRRAEESGYQWGHF